MREMLKNRVLSCEPGREAGVLAVCGLGSMLQTRGINDIPTPRSPLELPTPPSSPASGVSAVTGRRARLVFHIVPASCRFL
jgi:hypothetical protein